MNGLKYISFVEKSGYGIAAKRYLAALLKTGIPLTWMPLVRGTGWKMGYEPFSGQSVAHWLEFETICNRQLNYDVVLCHTVPEYYPIIRRREPGKWLIGYTVWETDRLPDHWPDLLNQVDHLMVPCQWNVDVFRHSGVHVPISVIPHLPDQSTTPEPVELPGVNPDDFVFYTVGEWTTRKAQSDLVEAFCQAFSASDRVVLVLKTSKTDFTRQLLRRHAYRSRWAVQTIVKRFPSPPRILLVTTELRDGQIAWLHKRGNCFVSMCHAEGWGMGAFEAAWSATPVIITGYGGQLDYLSKDFSYFIEYDLVSVLDRITPGSYAPSQHWAQPRINHAVSLLNEVFHHPEQSRQNAIQLQQRIQAQFSETQTIQHMTNAMKERR